MHRARLSPDYYQQDDNGSKYQHRNWAVRQGLSRSNVAKTGSAVLGLVGFIGTDGVQKLSLIDSTVLEGYSEPVPLWDIGLTGLPRGIYDVV